MPTRTIPTDSIQTISDRIAARLREELSQLHVDLPPSGTPGALTRAVAGLRGSAGQTDALRALLAGCASLDLRAALFVVKAGRLDCWEGAGFQDDFPSGTPRGSKLSSDDPTVSQLLAGSRALTVTAEGSPAVPSFGQAPRSMAVLVALRVQDKTAAVVYCDAATDGEPVDRNAVEILCEAAGLVIERQVLTRLAASRDEITGRQAASASPASISGEFSPTGPSASTSPASFSSSAAPSPAPQANAEPQGAPEVEDARRFARLLMEEIYLYHSDKVESGRGSRDVLARLGDEVDRARAYYEQRIAKDVRDTGNYFHEAMVKVLAGGDPAVLGETARQSN